MALITFLYKLYFLISILLSAVEATSKAARQQELLTACNAHAGCECTVTSHAILVPEIQMITWSRLRMECEAWSKFLKFAAEERMMVYNGASGESGSLETWEPTTALPPEIQEIVEDMKMANKEGRDGSKNEKKAFEIIHVLIKNEQLTEFKLIVDCDNIDRLKTFCSPSIKNDYLKYVTYLQINRVTHIGTLNNPVLEMFPNLRTLNVDNDIGTALSIVDVVEIYFVELRYLHTLTVEVTEKIIKLNCALDSELTCLSNPNGLNKFHVNLKLGGKLEVYGKWKLPKKISNLEILCEYIYANTRGNYNEGTSVDNLEKQTLIFRDVEFDNVHLKLCELKKGVQNTDLNLDYINISEFVGSNINKKVTIEGTQSAVNDILPAVYEMGWQDNLSISYTSIFRISSNGLPKSFDIPYIDIKQAYFDESQFANCKYGQKLLRDGKSSKHKSQENKRGLFVIRGFHLAMSAIKNIIDRESNNEPDSFNHVDIIRVYAYIVEVDIEPSNVILAGKKIEINYMYLGSSETSIIGVKTEKRNLTASSNHFNINYDDLKMQFYNNYKTRKTILDPIFMRALATCLMVNLDLSYKDVPANPLETDQQFSRWYKVIQRSKEFNDSIYTRLEIMRTESAVKNLEEYITLSYVKKDDVNRVPFLSLQMLSQNIRILSEAGKDMLDKSIHLKTLSSIEEIENLQLEGLRKTLTSVSDAKISILQASKSKSESLGDIELKKQEDLNTKIDESKEFNEHLTKKFDEFAELVKQETTNFKNGVKLATSLAIAEAAAEATGMILSIFSGGFNPAKALKAANQVLKLKGIINKLAKVMKLLYGLIRKRKEMQEKWKRVKSRWASRATRLTNFFKRQKDIVSAWWNNKAYVKDRLQAKDSVRFRKYMDQIRREGKSYERTAGMVNSAVSFLKAERTVRIGYDPGNPLEGVTLGDQKLSTVEDVIKVFENPEAKETEEQGKKLSAIDVFKWTIAKEHVTGMIDTTLSDDVPEATAYRTALLKLITTGETRTQASLDQAALETSFAASVYAHGLYTKEAVFIGEEIEKTRTALQNEFKKLIHVSTLRKEARKQRKTAEMGLEWEIFSIKLELVRLNEEYCNAFYYFHLEKCPQDVRIGVSDDLDRIFAIQNVLLYQSNQKLRDLYPPPQTFTDSTVTIKKPPHCQCVHHFLNAKLDSTTTASQRNSSRDAMHDAAKICLQGDGVIYSPKKFGETDKQLKERYHGITNEVMYGCIHNQIENIKADRQLIYKVDIDSPFFTGHERVRIDNVKAIFKGVATSNGILEIYGESTGIYEDRHNGKCFKFISEKWIRSLSYFSKNLLPKRQKRTMTIEDLNTKLEHIEEQLSQLKLNLQGDEITFIDSADVHNSFDGVFREPTVFTTWTFTIPDDRNPGLNLDGLDEIILKFSGSFVTTSSSAPFVQCKLTDEDEDGNVNSTETVDAKNISETNESGDDKGL